MKFLIKYVEGEEETDYINIFTGNIIVLCREWFMIEGTTYHFAFENEYDGIKEKLDKLCI